MLLDSHNHLQKVAQIVDIQAVIRTMKLAGITGCVVNGTNEADWEKVTALATQNPHFIRPAYGLHPWEIETASTNWFDKLRQLLLSDQTASVGEIGVDGWIKEPSIEAQQPFFHAQLELATELQRPTTIHCLKAWDTLFEVLDSKKNLPPRLLIHSFGGSIEIAKRLLKYDCFFSFSGYFLHPKKHKVIDVFKQLPKDRILLETDAPDMTPPKKSQKYVLPDSKNHPANLAIIGSALEREIGSGTLEQIARNSRDFWEI